MRKKEMWPFVLAFSWSPGLAEVLYGTVWFLVPKKVIDYIMKCLFHRRALGNEWHVSENIRSHIETFTCVMYGYAKDSSINLVRAKMLKKMVGEDNDLTKESKIDLSKLPPCLNSLIPHINRVNHRVAGYKRANVPIFEKPKPNDADQGWTINEYGILEPVWTIGPCLPQSLIDLMDMPRPKSLRSICRKFLGLSDEDDENVEMLVCGDSDDDEVDEMEVADCQSDEEED